MIDGAALEIAYTDRTGRPRPGDLPARRGGEGRALVPGGRDGGRAADVPGRPHRRGQAHWRAAERPADFDLGAAWAQVRDRVEDLRLPTVVQGLATVEVVPLLQWVLGRRLTVGGPVPDGRIEVQVRAATPERALAGELAGFGAALEITAPDDVRSRHGRHRPSSWLATPQPGRGAGGRDRPRLTAAAPVADRQWPVVAISSRRVSTRSRTERLRQRLVDGEVQRALRALVAGELVGQRRQDGAAVEEVAQVKAAKPATTLPCIRNAGIW